MRALRDSNAPNDHAAWTAAAAAACLFSSLYSYAWDLYMDWGLLRPSEAHRGLRDVLMLKEPRCGAKKCTIRTRLCECVRVR